MSKKLFAIKDSIVVNQEWIDKEIEDVMIELEEDIVNKRKDSSMYNLGILLTLTYLIHQDTSDSRYISMTRLVKNAFGIDYVPKKKE